MIKNFDKYEGRDLWCVFNEDTEIPEYFLTEKSAKNYIKKEKLKNYIIFQENN
jgi:hypothetical protein